MWWTPSNNSVLAEGQTRARLFAALACLTLIAGCATPQYAVRPTPVPEESPWAIQLERTISAYQAREFQRLGARVVEPGERVFGFAPQAIVDRLSRVTERPSLQYRVLMYRDRDPNAAALADGRVYLSTGMLNYLASRGSRESELAFVVAHELAHTVAQHLVKRYQQLQRQQMMLAVVGLGTAIATRQGGTQAQQLATLANDVASLVNDVIVSGYSQDQELEADQLGIRYLIRAGYDPRAALSLLEDFARYDVPWPFLRTHPYAQRRREDLARYLDEARRRLLQAQRLYPVGSQSWNNIQSQLDELERTRR